MIGNAQGDAFGHGDEGTAGSMGLGEAGSGPDPGPSASEAAVEASLGVEMWAAAKDYFVDTVDEIVDAAAKVFGDVRNSTADYTKEFLAEVGVNALSPVAELIDPLVPGQPVRNLAERVATKASNTVVDGVVNTFTAANSAAIPGWSSFEAKSGGYKGDGTTKPSPAFVKLIGKEGIGKDKSRNMVTKRSRLGSRTSYYTAAISKAAKQRRNGKRVIYK